MRRFGVRKAWSGGGIMVLVGGVTVAAGPAFPGAESSDARVTELLEPVMIGADEAATLGAAGAAGGTAADADAADAIAATAPAEAAGADAVLETQVGSASYYADILAGRRTASGIPYDPSAAVAAHRQLPFGTRLRVHNLGNGRSVEVEVVDRGPFAKGRILDLSRSAAEELDFIRAGHTRVRIEVLEYGGSGG